MTYGYQSHFIHTPYLLENPKEKKNEEAKREIIYQWVDDVPNILYT